MSTYMPSFSSSRGSLLLGGRVSTDHKVSASARGLSRRSRLRRTDDATDALSWHCVLVRTKLAARAYARFLHGPWPRPIRRLAGCPVPQTLQGFHGAAHRLARLDPSGGAIVAWAFDVRMVHVATSTWDATGTMGR